MLGWLRDTLASAPSSLVARHSTVPSTFFRRQKSKEREPISSDDDDETNPSNGNSFYHNPYHSSGQMNYVDVPQQQYTNEHTYPTYLARQQTSDSTLDDQIHSKLVSLQQRSGRYPAYCDRPKNYACRNRPLPRVMMGSSTAPSPSISQRDDHRPETINDRSDDNAEDEDRDDDDVENDHGDGDGEVKEDDGRSSSIGNYPGVPGYRSGRYAHDDEQFDFASVVLWYRNVMQSVKKIL